MTSFDDQTGTFTGMTPKLNFVSGSGFAVAEVEQPGLWKEVSFDCVIHEVDTEMNIILDTEEDVLDLANITIDPNHLLLCDVVNDSSSWIKIKKLSSPVDGDFDFDLTLGNGKQVITVTTTDGMSMETRAIQSGTYELKEINLPSIWTIKSSTCEIKDVDATASNPSDSANWSSKDPAVTFDPETTDTFTLDAWEAVECEYVNDSSSWIKIMK